MRYFLKTLLDIGFKKNILRVSHEIKTLIYIITPNVIIRELFFKFYKTPVYKKNILKNLDIGFNPTPTKVKIYGENLSFNFLNKEYQLDFPFLWNNKKQSKLWNFHLHYFDWLRELIENAIISKEWGDKSDFINAIIEDWIDKNDVGKGNGWHSYTISLRVRNWIWFFRCCPNLINKKIIDSIWKQTIWLYLNLEFHLEGNHLLENLTALIICTSQFQGKLSERILNFSIKKLKDELDYQILEDGGHYERSASYHLLMLDRLTEVACIFRLLDKKVPEWLITKIRIMLEWAKNIKIGENYFPRFNDSPKDGCSDINIILNFANSFLNNKSNNLIGLRYLILKKDFNFKEDFNFNKGIDLQIFEKKGPIFDLPQTGWTIIRPNSNWEFIFKCGKGCPKNLPGHVHSDLLSYELFYKGLPIISEIGTSNYGKSNIRDFERSGASHNCLQLGIYKPKKNLINWIEPIEVWGNFRAARKANIIKRELGIKSKGKFWVLGSHDGFKKLDAYHERYIEFFLRDDEELIFKCTDKIKSKKPLFWRQWWHLGPQVQTQNFKDNFELKLGKKKLFLRSKKTWYSENFGEKINRSSLYSYGKLEKGNNEFSSIIKITKHIINK